MTRYDRRRRRRGQSSLSTPPDGEESLERYGQAADARAATKAARVKGAARGMLCFFIPELIPRSRLGRGLVCERSTAPRTKSLWFVYGRILGNKEASRAHAAGAGVCCCAILRPPPHAAFVARCWSTGSREATACVRRFEVEASSMHCWPNAWPHFVLSRPSASRRFRFPWVGFAAAHKRSTLVRIA